MFYAFRYSRSKIQFESKFASFHVLRLSNSTSCPSMGQAKWATKCFCKIFQTTSGIHSFEHDFFNAKQIFSQFGNLKIIFKNQCSFTTNKLSSLCSWDSNSYSSIPFTQDQGLILSRKCVLNFMLFMPTD